MNIHPYSQCKIDINRFEKLKRITKGGFGAIYLVRDKQNGNQYAAKVIDCDDNVEQCKKLIDREIGIMMVMNHPTIIKFISFSLEDFQGENNVTIIMEHAYNGSLADILHKVQNFNGPSEYTNTSRQMILIGVSRGMKYLHDRNIIHRDLKPGNILIDENFQPHITDFGLSKFFEINHSKSQSQTVGTLSYMSPEVIKGSEYGTKTDVYSFAILMFEVLSDSSPYPDLENGKMHDFEFRIKVANENYRPVFKYQIKENLRKLIEDCWSYDPDMRPTFTEIFNKLSSEEYFIDDVDSNEINLYIQDITEICDPLEKLIQEKDVSEKKINSFELINKKLTEENSNLQACVEKLSIENEKLKNDVVEIQKKIDVQSLVTEYISKNSFIYYVNSTQIKPIQTKDDSLLQKIKNLSAINPFILGFNKQTDNELIAHNYQAVASYYKIKGTLHQLYSNLDDPAKYIVILGLALLFNKLNNQNIIHCDLIPEIILLNDSNISFLCDFGLPKFSEQKLISNNNLVFIAPEVHEGKEKDIKSDVYSYSMIVYLLLTNQIPSIEGTPYMIVTNILRGKRPDLSNINCKKLKMILQKCMSKKPKDRPTFMQIIDILVESDFYSTFNITSTQIVNCYKHHYNELPIKADLIEKELSIKKDASEKQKEFYSIFCFGNTGTGKTAMIISLNKNEVITNTSPTIGPDFINRNYQTKNGQVKLRIWDTSGAERSRSISFAYARRSDAIIFFTDVSQNQEYQELQSFFDNMEKMGIKDVPLYLATTKIDKGWKSTKEEIESFANEHHMKLFVTTIYDLSTVNHMFQSIAEDLTSK